MFSRTVKMVSSIAVLMMSDNAIRKCEFTVLVMSRLPN